MGARLRTAAVAACFVALMLAAPAHAAFPGANGKIAFQSARSIHTVNPDGTGEATIGNLGAVNVAWSADGTRIAYDTGGGGIYVANADGSGARNIGGTGGAANPAWSPDGRIVYDSLRLECFSSEYDCYEVPDGIFVMNSDGTGDHRLTTSGTEPAWSPDGTKIAFTDYDQNLVEPSSDIYVMNADGTGISKLTQTDRADEQSASWAPDGTKLAFVRIAWFSTFPQIWAINADGSGLTLLADDSARNTRDRYPAWSPDGTKIAIESDRTSYGGPTCPCVSTVIVVMDASGAHQTDIAFGERADWQPIPNRPPDCSGVSADPSVLWPPNRRLRLVELAGASDPDGDTVSLEITGVTQDERITGGRDAFPTSESAVRLRAKRDPRGDGRVYRIAFTVTDAKGVECKGTATASVPRHKKQAAVDSAPPSYDSFTR